jgi:hypothetical protein
MQSEVLLKELEAAAQSVGVQVNYESLKAIQGSGGLCRVRGAYRIIIDKRAQLGERVATLAQGLSQFDTSTVELSPGARDLLRHHALRRAV